MEVGALYNKKRLHGKKYFVELLDHIESVPESVIHMLNLVGLIWRYLQIFKNDLFRHLKKTA